MIKNAIIFLILTHLLVNMLVPWLLPYGPASLIPLEDYPTFLPIDPNNNMLKASSGKMQKIFERIPSDDATYQPLLKGPETVLVDDDGVIYIMSENSKLVSLTDLQQDINDPVTVTAKATEVAYLGGGRPLGGKFVSTGDATQTLYAADAVLGLIRVPNIPRIGAPKGHNNRKQVKQPIVEIVAKRVKVEDGSWSDIRYADDVDIGPKTGHVYFTDASDVFSERIGHVGKTTWGTMAASKIDLLRGSRTGRLLRYQPETGEVDVLATDLWFANGIGVDKDETFVVISETFAMRYLKYHLEGEKKGQTEVLINSMIGVPDGADCSHTTGLCYAAIITRAPSSVKILFSLPPTINRYLRTFFMILPSYLQPKVVPFGCFIEIFPGDENHTPKVTRVVQDFHGEDVGQVSGVTEHQGKLYLGSLENDHVVVYDLS
jgi:hypothetical protein